jgi:hypothetical protein
MKIRNGVFRGSLWLIGGLALFAAYAGSIVLSLTWVPALIGPLVAIAAATDAISGTAQHRVEANNVELAMLLDWHIDANHGGSYALNAPSRPPRPIMATLPLVQSDRRLCDPYPHAVVLAHGHRTRFALPPS